MAIAFAAVPAAADAAWNQPVDRALNVDATQDARVPAAATVAGVPYVAWTEARGSSADVLVAALGDGGDWTLAGSALDFEPASATSDGGWAIEPSVADIGGTLYAAWSERPARGDHFLVRVARLGAGGWERVGGTPNLSTDADGRDPVLARGADGAPVVAWIEGDTQNFEVRAATLTAAGAWQPVGGKINHSERAAATIPGVLEPARLNAYEVDIESIGDVPHVAWTEQAADGNREARVARLRADGSAWDELDAGESPINRATDRDATAIDLQAVAGTPFVAWREYDGARFQVRSSRWTGVEWAELPPVNRDPARSAGDPSLADVGGRPWIAWSEHDGVNDELRVARLDGAAWTEPVGGASPLNDVASQRAQAASLVAVGGIPFVTWAEGYAGGRTSVRVSRLEPEFLQTTVAPGPTTATVVTTLEAFGLPYQVAFEYAGTRTAFETLSGDSITATLTGLTPRTEYTVRPVARAGVPAPEVVGDAVTFSTTKKNGR